MSIFFKQVIKSYPQIAINTGESSRLLVETDPISLISISPWKLDCFHITWVPGTDPISFIPISPWKRDCFHISWCPRESKTVATFPMFVSNPYETIVSFHPEYSVLNNIVNHSEQDNLEFNLQVIVAWYHMHKR